MNYIGSSMFLVLAVGAQSPYLLENFVKCSYPSPTFADCLRDAIPRTMVSLRRGSQECNVQPLEPLGVDNIFITNDGRGETLPQNYTNIYVYNITAGLHSENVNVIKSRRVLKLTFINERVVFAARYSVNGNFGLFVPVIGTGTVVVTTTNLKSEHHVEWSTYMKNEQKYLEITKYTMHLSADDVAYHYDNLFADNPFMRLQMEEYLRSNSRILFQQNQHFFARNFAEALMEKGNKLFSCVPLNELIDE